LPALRRAVPLPFAPAAHPLDIACLFFQMPAARPAFRACVVWGAAGNILLVTETKDQTICGGAKQNSRLKKMAGL
jgi:hypothetical protein